MVAGINSSVTHLKMTESKPNTGKSKCETAENIQANSILKIIHQGIENLVRMFELKIST